MKNILLAVVVLSLCVGCSGQAEKSEWLPASYDKLPRWKGFNLGQKYKLEENAPYRESDFALIHEFGFNLVRLPLDYRIWIKDGNWMTCDENQLKEIDQAIEWGKKYKIHINIDFHFMPGYSYRMKKIEEAILWKDEAAQKAAAFHWALFAKRYKGIPNERLSFNLINEPRSFVDPKDYVKVITLLVEAVRKEDPNRLIIADGLRSASVPCEELIPLKIAQSWHHYQPFWLTHYKAPWVPNAPTEEPVPTWPMVRISPYLEAGTTPTKSKGPLEISGAFPAGVQLSGELQQAEPQGKYVIRADGEKIFEQDASKAEGLLFSVKINKAATKITLSNEGVGTLLVKSARLQLPGNGKVYELPILPPFKNAQQYASQVDFTPGNPDSDWNGAAMFGVAWLKRGDFYRWEKLMSQNVGVMVGEWGVFNTAPYEPTLQWTEDTLKLFKEANIGWALWNFSGPFGVVNSNRKGAVYEDYKGYKVDRRMLELLQEY